MADDIISPGQTRWFYTGNKTGYFNYTGFGGYVSGGPPGSGISTGVTVGKFFPNTGFQRPWLNDNATFNDALLDACYPTIGMSWIADIELSSDIIFRVSDKSLYVTDKNGVSRFYDARAEKAPNISINLGEWLSPNYQISDLQLTLNNRDGYYNQYLPFGNNYKSWPKSKVTIKIGIGEKYENYFTIFEGSISTQQGIQSTRDNITIRAYDKLEDSNIVFPPRTFSTDDYPSMSEDAGKPIPIIYGDWTEEVNAWGNIKAFCTNDGDETASSYNFKVSDIPLQSITSIWLHRGDRAADTPKGPVPFNLGALSLNLEDGSFSIPKGPDVLQNQIVLVDNQSAAAGSGPSILIAKDSSIDFIALQVQPGDLILQKRTGAYTVVTAVAVSFLNHSGGANFAADDDYAIYSYKYGFVKGDKISVTCVGKKLNLMSVTRLGNVNTAITKPQAVSITYGDTYWIADDNSQTIYNISFENEVLRSIPYSSINADTVLISGLFVGNDNQLWTVEPDKARISRYDYVNNGTNQSFTTSLVTGLGFNLVNISGITVKPDNTIWIVNSDSPTNVENGTFYHINVFTNAIPFVISSFNKSSFDNSAIKISDLSYDYVTGQLIVIDQSTNKYYRITESGSLVSSAILSSTVSNEITYPSGVSYAQDGTLFFLDYGTAAIYNYNEVANPHRNAAYIARDMLQSFAGHKYDSFNLGWNTVASQLNQYRARAVFADSTKMISAISNLLRQFNTNIFLKFQKLAIFYMSFENFITNGKFVSEKDIKLNTFSPTKELNQYFNSASATYSYNQFSGQKKTSDTYQSPAAISFLGSTIGKQIDMPNVYRRLDIDKLVPLFIRLSAADPEFVNVGLGFRVIRSQIQDFYNLEFDGDLDPRVGQKTSGRRYNNIPCMIRSINYNLEEMSIQVKLWSLGSTAFGTYVPSGNYVGGQYDQIVLPSTGRLGRISATARITAVGSNYVDVLTQDGNLAQNRTNVLGLTWKPGYKLQIANGSTHELLQNVTISSVFGNRIFFEETISGVSNSVVNAAGFFTGGHYLKYAQYGDNTTEQIDNFASYSKPAGSYPTSQSQELAEQRAGDHSFTDGGKPYLLYPKDYVPV